VTLGGSYSGDFYMGPNYPTSLKINKGDGYYEDYPVSAGDLMDFTVLYGNPYYSTDRASIKIEMMDNFGTATVLHDQGYNQNLYNNPATFASKV